MIYYIEYRVYSTDYQQLWISRPTHKVYGTASIKEAYRTKSLKLARAAIMMPKVLKPHFIFKIHNE